MRNVEAFREGRIKTRTQYFTGGLRLNKRKRLRKIPRKKLNEKDTEDRLVLQNISKIYWTEKEKEESPSRRAQSTTKAQMDLKRMKSV